MIVRENANLQEQSDDTVRSLSGDERVPDPARLDGIAASVVHAMDAGRVAMCDTFILDLTWMVRRIRYLESHTVPNAI